MANHLFQQTTEGMLDEVLSWDPSRATQLGWRRYDHEMRDLSAGAYKLQAARLKEFIRQMEGYSDDQLTEEERIDRDLALHLFRLWAFEIEHVKMHERMAMATEDLGNALFFLFSREDDTLENRLDAIIARLRKVPEYLERSKDALVSPCRLHNEIALETGKALTEFLDTIESGAREMLGRTDRTARLSEAVELAKRALASYNRWLERDVIPAAANCAHMTTEMFEEYMRLKGLEITPEDALRVGEAHHRRTRNLMSSVAKQMCGSGSVDQALAVMKSQHPATFQDVLECYRKDILRARTFIMENDLATIPDGEKLLILETPPYMRHVAPFAAQYEPGKFTGDRTGLFLVTTNPDPEVIKDHCYALITNTAVHEGYPGHHLQGICGNTHPSHIRVLSASYDFAEGWALYCEELMLEAGFSKTPEGRLAQLSDLMFRVVRVLADVRLSRGETTPEEVASMLIKETGMQKEAALSEARSYCYCPTCYLSYFIGKMALLQLLDDVKEAMGPRFSLKLFHDTLLYAGCLPISFMRREMAMRLREDYGIDLGEPKESLAEYALRKANTP